MSNFVNEVERTMLGYNMIDPNDTVIAALSGGADSVSLLYALNSLKEKYSLNIKAAHLNHNLRGAEAERDEKFVRSLCENLKIELFVKSVDIKKIAETEKIGTELAGRNERYKFFSGLSEKYGAKIATAHNADDNLETVIFNLIRGAGINGMSGIKPVRDNIIRPLIRLSRTEIESYIEENSLSYVTDSTNLTDDYTRNKIRHSLVPIMKEINPNVLKNVADETEIFSSVNSYLELKSDEYIKKCRTENGYKTDELKKIPDEIKPTVIYRLLKQNEILPEYKHISLILSVLNSGAVDLNGSIRAVSKQGILRFTATDKPTDCISEIELKIPMEFKYNGNDYSVKEIKNSPEALKLSVIENSPVFRTRSAGDKFTLPKRKVTKSLKKLFNELKIPEENRDSILILASGSEVYWIDGIGASENARDYNESGFIIKKF